MTKKPRFPTNLKGGTDASVITVGLEHWQRASWYFSILVKNIFNDFESFVFLPCSLVVGEKSRIALA